MVLALLVLLVAVPVVYAQNYASQVLSSTTCPGSGCVTLNVTGQGNASFQIVGSGTWTAQFEGSLNGIDFAPLNVVALNGLTAITSTTVAGSWAGSIGGLTKVQIRLSAYTSGTPSAYIQTSQSGGSSGAGGGGGSNAAAGATGSAVPASASYEGVNIAGNLTGVTGLALGATTKAPTVAIVDGSGNQITTFGGSGGTASSYGSAFPASGTAVGFSDGTNMQGSRVVDFDTGAGTIYGLITNLVRRASGGPVELIGQTTMANSVPVVFASDQSALTVATHAVTGSGTFTVDSELSTAAAASDTTGNPTAGGVLAFNMVWDGSANWKRARESLLSETAHDTTLGTITSVVGNTPMFRASAAAPADVNADGDAVIPWALRNGSPVVNLAAGGTLITATSTSLNTNITNTSAVSGFGVGATGSAVPANASFIGGRTGANLEPFAQCDQQALLKMTTATTTEIVALTASQKVRVCYANMLANGTTTAKFVYGTGANCVTGPVDITPAYDLTAQVGWSGGAGIGTILDTAAGNALCVTNGSAVNLSIFVRYTKY